MDAKSLNLTTQITGHGRFLFLQLDPARVDSSLLKSIEDLGSRLVNMHFVDGSAGEEDARRGRLQYLRAEMGLHGARDIPDDGMAHAAGMVRIEGTDPEPLAAFEDGLRTKLSRCGGKIHALSGIQKPRSYTSYAMTQYAYAGALPPASGARHPFGVVTPQNKTEDWWKMDWMRRESLFLPQYDESGNMRAKGHALASGPGVPYINRRLFHSAQGYGQGTGYDFVGYFEFAERDARVFNEVMAALRDRSQNPEWNYVREGPEWWGRRVGKFADILTGA